MSRDTCKRGHPWSPGNTFLNARGIRECRECKREANQRYKQRRRDAGLKINSGPRKNRPIEVACIDCGSVRTLANNMYARNPKRCGSCAQKKAMRDRGFRAPRVTRCEVCDRAFTHHGVRPRKTCSRTCRGQWLANRMAGTRKREENPNFRHGERVGAKKWGPSHKGETHCRLCGRGDSLHLHHVIPRSKYRAGIDVLLNGITLCASCHSRWHHKTLTVYRDVFTAEEWAWLSSQQLTGERIEAWLDKHYPVRPKEKAA